MTGHVQVVLGLAAAAAAWFLLAPAQLGGSASYVVVEGASMAPGLERGDLVIVRKAAAYREGDAVAYRHPELGRTVLHRVVRVAGGRLQLKGDANSFADFAAPRRVEVVGKQWLRVPKAGLAIEWLRAPERAGLAVGAFALILTAGTAAGGRGRRRKTETQDSPRRPPRLAGPNAETALLAVAGAGALLLALGLVALAKPATTLVPWDGLYRHHGVFSYAGDAPRGPVYPSGRVRSGETAFVRLVPSLRIRFDYRLDASGPPEVAGSASLVARIEGDNGWSRDLPLVPRRAFRGAAARLEAELDLRGVLALGRRVAAATGTASDSYLVTLRPRVRVDGSVREQAVADTFAPALALRLDGQKLRPEQAGNLVRSAAGDAVRHEPSRLGPVTVSAARTVGLVGGLLALAAAAAGWCLLRAGRGRDEPTRIATQLGSWLVESAPQERPDPVHELASFDDLVRVAERYERVILHEQRGREHSYLVDEGGTVYRYRTWSLDGAGRVEEAEDTWTSLRRVPA